MTDSLSQRLAEVMEAVKKAEATKRGGNWNNRIQLASQEAFYLLQDHGPELLALAQRDWREDLKAAWVDGASTMADWVGASKGDLDESGYDYAASVLPTVSGEG